MARVLRDGAFSGETPIVTGAAQGIGRGVATMLAEHGAQVALGLALLARGARSKHPR